MNTTSSLHKKIQGFRQRDGITQAELAKKVGLSRGAIITIEQGKRKVTVEELSKLREVFNCSYSDFLVADQPRKSANESRKKNIHDLYNEYQEKYRRKDLPHAQKNNLLDDYLRQVNPYYYPSSNNEIRYE